MTSASTNSPEATDTGKPALQSRNGSQAIVDTLRAANVEYVFGYPGGGTSHLISAISNAGLPSIAARTELSAAWMSYGYNRVKRRAASACVFHCVGALHVTPAVYAAKLDSTPLFMMDVNLSNALDLREGLQEGLEIYPTLKQVSKYIRKVTTAEDLPLAVRQAVLNASTGRFGPSVLDMGFQVLSQQTTCAVEPLELPAPPGASTATLEKAMSMIKAARNPVIIAGAGVHLSNGSAPLLRFAELHGIPVVSTSWGGRGVVPDSHPLFGGIMGAFGWISANELVQRADLWIALGTTFSQMTTGAWTVEKPLNTIQVDIDPGQIGKIFQPTLGIAADISTVLTQLCEARERSGEPAAKWQDDPQIQRMQEDKRKWLEFFNTLGATSEAPINQYYLIQRMNALLPKGSIVVGDSGGNAFMVHRAFDFKEVTPMVVGSRYMSLGAGLPMAIGAKLADPQRVVVAFHGDGGFYYDLSELSVLAQYGIKVIVIIDNNYCLMANKAGFKMMGFNNPWTDLPQSTDFVTVAKGFGVPGERVTTPEQVDAALQRALDAPGSYLIDVITDPATRVRRAIKDVIPILSDRPPSSGAEKHISPPLEGSWPNRHG